MTSAQPKDAPKVQIETTGAFGQSVVKQISLDTNRLTVKVDALQGFSNAIAIPRRGIFADSALWILGIAVLIRWPLSLAIAQVLPLWGLGLGLGLIAAPIGFALFSVWIAVPEQRPDVCYRACQITAAVMIATRFLWLV